MNSSSQLKQLVSEVFSRESEVIKNSTIKKLLSETIINPIKRAKLWELDEMYHCPVIGICLSVNDLEKLAKRCSFSTSHRDEYAMHVEAVDRVGTRNEFSKAVQRHLDMKYRSYITCFSKVKTEAELRALWDQYYIDGKGPSAMWALLTHKLANVKTRQIIYADMHMLSHQAGAGQAADMRRLNQLKKDNTDLRSTLEQQKQQQVRVEEKLQAKLRRATDELNSLRQTQSNMATLQARIANFESGTVMVEMGRRLAVQIAANEQLRVKAGYVAKLEKSLEGVSNRVNILVQERDSLSKEKDMLQSLLQVDVTDGRACTQQLTDAHITTYHSCILCVGGRIALLPQYRKLAKKLGISLIHHDGGEQEALSRLPDLISRAKAVICPTDCVSHAAYYQLKRYCKRNNKPCLLFKGAGISSFTKALTELSTHQSNQQNGNIIKLRQEVPGT